LPGFISALNLILPSESFAAKFYMKILPLIDDIFDNSFFRVCKIVVLTFYFFLQLFTGIHLHRGFFFPHQLFTYTEVRPEKPR
jgi:hypothetical protein